MPRRDITEGHVILFNPCPELTEAELDDLIGHVDYKSKPDKQVFEIEVVYGNTGTDIVHGNEYMHFVLKPGEYKKVLQSAASELKDTYSEQGLAIASSEEELNKSIQTALQKFHEFLTERGPVQITKYKQRHGLQDHEMEAEKSSIISYYKNTKKAEIIEKHLRDFLAEQRAKATKAKE